MKIGMKKMIESENKMVRTFLEWQNVINKDVFRMMERIEALENGMVDRRAKKGFCLICSKSSVPDGATICSICVNNERIFSEAAERLYKQIDEVEWEHMTRERLFSIIRAELQGVG